jgi:ribonuclease E
MPRRFFIMANKMLIDASHREETRVVVVRGNRIEEFDFESEHKKQIRGNIYLARVTRVEPSLQAAFVEYGGNRHGFLAFSEIHPDYYQIPIADRQALLEAEAREHAEEDDEERPVRRAKKDDRDGRDGGRRRGRRDRVAKDPEASDDVSETVNADEQVMTPEQADAETDAVEPSGVPGADADETNTMSMAVEADVVSEGVGESEDDHDDEAKKPADDHGDEDDGHTTEQRQGRRTARRQYKIQEVIKRRQVLLVQVVKEERGNKGAALTTYLSLAGRYSVLMPNTGRGGGISRKITSIQDRKRLKDVVKDLDVPQGMGVILRTAGANRTKAEIKRDYEYLMRMWETVRTLTLESTAPALVYEEGSLIKRSIRDLYNKDISEILVAGEDGYREAKDFMRMLMPSHAKMVQPYRESTPIFARAGIESQLDRMLQPQVTLKSGGYIIINQTEALVAVDVNSGRSTREHSIEDTALQTNLEAAEEVARQLRLRDLAGLIVIDFIDMEENRNNRAVEKRLKDCLKNDRARIQVGRISHFGLMEMSRQRIRTSVLESTTQVCTHCGGVGHVRSPSSIGLHIVRSIEEHLQRESGFDIVVRTPTISALYVLNHKRSSLTDLEDRFGLNISVEADESVGAQHLAIDRGPVSTRTPSAPKPSSLPAFDETDPDIPLEEDEEIEGVEGLDAELSDEESSTAPAAAEMRDGDVRRGKRRRRRRGRGRDAENGAPKINGDAETTESGGEDTASDEEANGEVVDAAAKSEAERKKRRRGRRGGRRQRGDETSNGAESASGAEIPETSSEAVAEVETSITPEAAAEPVVEAKPKRSRAKKVKEAVEEPDSAPEPVAEAVEPTPTPVKKARAKRAPAKQEAVVEEVAVASEPVVSAPTGGAAEPDGKPRKAGWWQRKSFF